MVIDTGIFIEYLRIKEKSASTLIPDNSSLFVSAISVYELYMGVTSTDKENDIQVLTNSLSILPFTDEVAIK